MEIADGIHVVKNLYPRDLCAAYLLLSERLGYEAAPINSSIGVFVNPQYRNNSRVILDDEELADEIWQVAASHLPSTLYGRRALGLNERLRFYRYDVGEKFEAHVDGYYRRPNGEQSLLTFMLYLNEDFEGGETNFTGGVSIKPETGMVLVFQHQLTHEGAAVTKGRKYVLRSDIMFSL
jgi:predicted 2-oxoglutarate/Fe(II)-dependent dioxygenase YbiX